MRLVCAVHASCALISIRKSVNVSIKLRNICTRGLGFHMPVSVEPGAFLVVRLWKSRVTRNNTLRARVVHATPLDDGQWYIGCKLIDRLPQNDLDALL